MLKGLEFAVCDFGGISNFVPFIIGRKGFLVGLQWSRSWQESTGGTAGFIEFWVKKNGQPNVSPLLAGNVMSSQVSTLFYHIMCWGTSTAGAFSLGASDSGFVPMLVQINIGDILNVGWTEGPTQNLGTVCYHLSYD